MHHVFYGSAQSLQQAPFPRRVGLHTWTTNGGMQVFTLEILRGNRLGERHASFRQLTGRTSWLDAASKAEFMAGLMAAFSRLRIDDDLSVPLLNHPDVRRLLP